MRELEQLDRDRRRRGLTAVAAEAPRLVREFTATGTLAHLEEPFSHLGSLALDLARTAR